METTQEPQQEQQEETPVEYTKPNKKYVCFAEAHEFARTMTFKNRKEWRAWVRGEFADRSTRPINIPGHPDGIYKTKGWKGWKHWLGTERVS